MNSEAELFYRMLYKRKSFHLFRNSGNEKISPEELEAVKTKYKSYTPLDPKIRTAVKIVPAKETACRRGQEYCVLFYSEKKGNYLQNIGYLGEQLELELVSRNIGTLWFGSGQAKEATFEGLDFVIMMAIAKIDDEKKFRKDMLKSRRKPVEDIWRGVPLEGVAELVRFAPSACNTQPWLVEHTDGILKVYRYQKPGKRGIMPAARVAYYNRIDMGIFLCLLDLCLLHNNMGYKKELYDDTGCDGEKILTAIYTPQ